MRFIVDESTGAAVVEHLRRAGHDVLAVAETMPQAADDEILTRAVADARIVVTNDKDFGDLVYRSGQAHHGILLLRPSDEDPSARVRLVRTVLAQYADRLPDAFTVATDGKMRIRALRDRDAD